MEEKAKQFWTTQNTYPKYGTIKQRRLHELNFIVPKLQETKSLLDLGCGDGALIECLMHLTDIKEYHAYDISSNWITKLAMKHKNVYAKVYDCAEPQDLPETDVTVCAGVLPFLFKDEQVHNLMEKIKSPTVYIKAPCSMEEKEILVDTFSEKLNAPYASLYRTPSQIKALLSHHFSVSDPIRAYPDDIESEFGTKQFIFICSK